MTMDLVGVFAAGLLTFATPCVLPLIPIYLALLMGGVAQGAPQGGAAGPGAAAAGAGSRLTLLRNTALFSLGFIAVFVALGLTATSLGSLLAEHRDDLVLAGGLLVFLFGLKFLGLLRVGWLERERRLGQGALRPRHGAVNALVMGLVFALGWTPCVGPILGSVLTYTATATSDPLRGALYLAVYGLGFAAPLLVLSVLGDTARALVRRVSPHLPRLERITGALLAVVGLYLIFGLSRPPQAELSPVPGSAAGVVIEPPLGQPSVRPRLVEFVSPACSVCRQMIPTVALVERDCGGRNVDVIKVDVSHQGNRELARRYGVRGVPTFLFIDAAGKELARQVGYQTLQSLRQSLAVLVGERCQGVGDLLRLPPAGQCETAPGGSCG